MFGYFPAPFVFGFVADINKEDPIASMRMAIGTITYWSIFAAMFLLIAMLCRFSSSDKEQYDTELTEAEADEKGIRQGKGGKKGVPIVLSPRQALSSQYGDSNVSLPNAPLATGES